VAALVSEADHGADLDGDGDTTDSVVQVHRLADPPTEWANVGQAGDRIVACGRRAVFITPENVQGADLNLDGDQDDRVLQLFDPATATLTNTQQAARELVCNDLFVAFRTPEEAQGETDLNEDGDLEDHVLQVYEFAPATLRNTHQPVRICDLDACDPRIPYRASLRSVKFLTFECDQEGPVIIPGDDICRGGVDLNDDGDPHDLIIQVYDMATGLTRAIGESRAGDPFQGGSNSEEPDGGVVYQASGRCLEPAFGFCTTTADCNTPGTDCEPHPDGSFCFSQDDCGPERVCEDFRCMRGICTTGACEMESDCPLDSTCFDGLCQREQGVCTTDEDCPPGITCAGSGIVPASPDSDVDAVPDHLDNCPFAENAAQTDTDGDRVGDACDLATCGNGVAEPPDESCDGLDATSCPAQCTAGCTCPDAECPNVMPRRPGSVLVRTFAGHGKLRAQLRLDLGTYAGEPIAVRLADTDPGSIAEAQVPLTLARSGKWRFRSSAPGVQRVILRKLGPSRPGMFALDVVARQWFTAAAANQPAADTRVTITVGAQCFTHVVTHKVD
jgi:hypothetical protein